MALIEEELKIVELGKIIKEDRLKIPYYQRPYRWTKKTVMTLFYDIKQAYEENKEEYRIGTIILHKDKAGYNIVYGQQRLTTLCILLLNREDE